MDVKCCPKTAFTPSSTYTFSLGGLMVDAAQPTHQQQGMRNPFK